MIISPTFYLSHDLVNSQHPVSDVARLIHEVLMTTAESLTEAELSKEVSDFVVYLGGLALERRLEFC
jgi:hypothetical protein